jgi:hypothetical protein
MGHEAMGHKTMGQEARGQASQLGRSWGIYVQWRRHRACTRKPSRAHQLGDLSGPRSGMSCMCSPYLNGASWSNYIAIAGCSDVD